MPTRSTRQTHKGLKNHNKIYAIANISNFLLIANINKYISFHLFFRQY